jgi:hypothetical protein
MEVSGQLHALVALLPGKEPLVSRNPSTHWIEGWVGPRAGVDEVARKKNPSPSQESNPAPSAHCLGISGELGQRMVSHLFGKVW